MIGVSAVAVRTRLSRSRARLRALLGNDPQPPGQVPVNHPSLVPEEGR